MGINYHNRTFRSTSNTDNGQVSGDTQFHYQQSGDIVTASYGGGQIIQGNLIAKVLSDQSLDMRYHHIDVEGNIQTGICKSTPEVLENGKIRLHESWQWTSGDLSKGQSVIEEV